VIKPIFTNRLKWLLWLAALALLISEWCYPPSTEKTRFFGGMLVVVIWCGLITLMWKQRLMRNMLIGISCLAVFMVLSTNFENRDSNVLREEYVAALRRYQGVKYYWGGESPKGIDCSGLIRRGLIDSMFLRRIRTGDGGLVRFSLWLWWHDCTARDLGDGDGFTTHLFFTKNINELSDSKILPGDLAVTSGGSHIMAYLGNKQWIEADPLIGKVITVTAPSKENVFFYEPVNIVRWNLFNGQ
jgi:hypothetical protein